MVGNNVSHANNKNKRKFYPNLQIKSFVPETIETVILKFLLVKSELLIKVALHLF